MGLIVLFFILNMFESFLKKEVASLDAVDVEKGKRQKGKELLEGKRSRFVRNSRLITQRISGS